MKKRIISMVMAFAMALMLFPFFSVTASAATNFTVDTSKYHTIKNVKSGRYLNVYCNSSQNNANITLWAKDGTSGEDFKFVKSGSSYVLVPRCATSRAVNIYCSSSARAGNNVCTWTKTGHSSQSWIPEYISASKAFVLRSANNRNLVLTASGTGNGANICVQTYSSGNAAQLWTSSALKVTSSGSSQATTTTAKCDFIWPLANGAGSVSSPVGPRWGTIHVGTDIAAKAGTPIIAVAKGTVVAAGYTGARGNYVTIRHGAYICVYQHMRSSASVKAGQSVSQGQVIGYVGNTGESYGDHLHFEMVLESSLSKRFNLTECLWGDVTYKYGKPAYYSVSKGEKVGNYYKLNMKRV